MVESYSECDGLVRVYPATAPNGSGLVWVHGGAFAWGALDMPEADAVAQWLADRGTVVVSVDYRLAPVPPEWAENSGSEERGGHIYPAASDDVLTAWSWALAHAAELGVTSATLALGGASAGANLAVGAALRLLEAGSAALPALVLLAYPTLHAVQPAPSAELHATLEAHATGDRFTPEAIVGMYQNYLGGDVTDAPLSAIPGTATPDDLVAFPPTFIVNSEVDDLRASGEAFAQTLRAAGCEVVSITEAGTRHGHLNEPALPVFSATLERFAARLALLTLTP